MLPPAILQTYLDEVSAAFMQDDWPAYRTRVLLPLHDVAHDGNRAFETEAELRHAFDQLRDTLRFHRVTDFIRLVEQAALLEPDLISGSYLTHLIAGGHRLLDPFRSQITLRLVDGAWLGASVTNALGSSRWSLTPTPVPETDPKGPKT